MLNLNNFLLYYITPIVTVFSVIIALLQYMKANKVKRAELINQIIEKLRFNEELQETFLMIDYNNKWYNESFHNKENDIEKKVDRLLAYFSYLCYLRNLKFLSKKEFTLFEYQLNRICISPQVQNYLWNLYHFSKKNNAKTSFNYLIDYGLKNNLFYSDFNNKDTSHYTKYLNF